MRTCVYGQAQRKAVITEGDENTFKVPVTIYHHKCRRVAIQFDSCSQTATQAVGLRLPPSWFLGSGLIYCSWSWLKEVGCRQRQCLFMYFATGGEMDCALKRLERGFLNMYPIKLLSVDVDTIIEKGSEIGSDWQKDVLNNTLKHPLNVKHEIDPKYEHAFLKLIISRLESEGIEVCDELYENLCNLLTHQKEQDTVFKHYILDNASRTCISLKESKNIISQGTTGLHCWQAAQALADWCLSHSEDLHGKRVLELGSGVGLTGIATVLCCELQSYTFSDCHSAVLNTLCENVLLNLSTPADKDCHRVVENDTKSVENTLLKIKHKNTDVAVITLPWADINKDTVSEVDFVLAADVVYDTSIFTDLCQALRNLLHDRKTVAIIACTVRDQNTLQQFLHTLDQYEINIVQNDIPVDSPTHFLLPQDVLVNIYRLKS